MNKKLANFYSLFICLIIVSRIFKFLSTVDAMYCLLVIIAISIVVIGSDRHVQQ